MSEPTVPAGDAGDAAGGRRRRLNWRTVAAAAAGLPVLFIGGLDWKHGTPAQASQAPMARIGAQQADPVRVRVPRLHIDAAMEPLHVDRVTEELQPPEYGRAGWYQAGPEPGEPGRAVIAGHLDSKKGPDVFWSLKKAHKGDRIVVDTADGTSLTFVVQAVELHRRDQFPTGRVYGGPRRTPELRLITCGGSYVKAKGGYQSNVVVFAVPA